MLFYTFLYATLAMSGVAALTIAILHIGQLLTPCPERGAAARITALTVACAFAAIGAGGVILIGALLPMLAETPLVGMPLALGLAILCLGLGFTQAVAQLHAVMQPGGLPTVAEDVGPA